MGGHRPFCPQERWASPPLCWKFKVKHYHGQGFMICYIISCLKWTRVWIRQTTPEYLWPWTPKMAICKFHFHSKIVIRHPLSVTLTIINTYQSVWSNKRTHWLLTGARHVLNQFQFEEFLRLHKRRCNIRQFSRRQYFSCGWDYHYAFLSLRHSYNE